MFDSSDATRRVVELLTGKRIGYSREEIITRAKLPNNGVTSRLIQSLISAGFVVSYLPFEAKRKIRRYKLVDSFCLFCSHFILRKNAGEDFWIQNFFDPSVVSWRGFAFEEVCFNHIDQIKDALGIRSVGCEALTWYGDKDGDGSQIDLLLKRKDNVINVCEVKFYSDAWTLDGDGYRKILSRTEKFYSYIPKKFSVQNTLIATYGLVKNAYSGVFQSTVTLQDLFKF